MIGQYIHLIGGQGAINLQSKSDLILIRGYMQETFLSEGGRKLSLTMNVENVIPLIPNFCMTKYRRWERRERTKCLKLCSPRDFDPNSR